MKTILIQVKRKHIREGEPGMSSCCPIALAFRERTGKTPTVGSKGICVKFAGRSDLYLDFGANPSRFVRAFDACQPVKPFRFRLRLPNKAAALLTPEAK